MTDHPNFADGRPIGQHMTEIVRGLCDMRRARKDRKITDAELFVEYDALGKRADRLIRWLEERMEEGEEDEDQA